MFTGLIEGIGKVIKYERSKLTVQTPFRRIRKGESICVNGVCLTVVGKQNSSLTFDVGPETRRVTTLGALIAGRFVNLERALRVGDRLGGHWVSGHVEDTGRIVKIEKEGDTRWVSIAVPQALHRYIIVKGSIAIDGISLTVVSIIRGVMKVMIIPHTWTHTTLGRKKIGDFVNLEPDLLAKYAEAIRHYS